MRKPAKRNAAVKKRPTVKKKSVFSNKNKGFPLIIILVFLILFGIGYHYRNGLLYYLGFKSDKVTNYEDNKQFSDVRNFQLLNKYVDKVAGIDVSEYQGKINWNKVKTIENKFPVQFVFIRATAGKNKKDSEFEKNWNDAKKNKLIRGAYHYYRPNENSLEQAKNFIENVQLQPGDLPPVLDIESIPKNQSIDSLKVGLRRWLQKVDSHYKIKPIIYSGEKYYDAFLKEEFNDYSFWIANYNFFSEELKDDWLFWQFTEKALISGIKGNVDVNIFNGTPKQLKYLTVSN